MKLTSRLKQIVKETFTWEQPLLNYLTGRWAGRDLKNSLKDISYDIKDILKEAKVGEYQKIIEEHKDVLKAFEKVNKKSHALFTIISVRVDDVIKRIKVFHRTVIRSLNKKLDEGTKAALGKAFAEKIEKLTKEKLDKIDKFLREEYEKLLQLEKESKDAGKRTVMAAVREATKTEGASYAKFFLGRLNLRKLNRSITTAKENEKDVYSILVQFQKGEKPERKVVAKLNRGVKEFYKAIDKAISNSYYALMRLFLLRLNEIEKLEELVGVDLKLRDKVIIPEIVQEALRNKIEEIRKDLHEDITLETQKLIIQERTAD